MESRVNWVFRLLGWWMIVLMEGIGFGGMKRGKLDLGVEIMMIWRVFWRDEIILFKISII